MDSTSAENVFKALENFRIELPTWGFADTGTRFGKYLQPAAAVTIEEKLSDAGLVHALTGASPTVAVHVVWDFPRGAQDAERVGAAAERNRIRIGAINPNLFQDQEYKFGSFGNPSETIRKKALQHCLESIDIAHLLGSRDISLWFAYGSNYPGTANIRQRKHWFEENLAALHAKLHPGQRLLIEYKPFEPAFYHTDIADC
jgi:L-rhamnose isomerase/sugar isomerase